MSGKKVVISGSHGHRQTRWKRLATASHSSSAGFTVVVSTLRRRCGDFILIVIGGARGAKNVQSTSVRSFGGLHGCTRSCGTVEKSTLNYITPLFPPTWEKRYQQHDGFIFFSFPFVHRPAIVMVRSSAVIPVYRVLEQHTHHSISTLNKTAGWEQHATRMHSMPVRKRSVP